MGIFNDLKASDDDVASNEVDKTARATGSEILDSIFNLTREITSDMMSLDDTAENMADKACLTEILKGKSSKRLNNSLHDLSCRPDNLLTCISFARLMKSSERLIK